MMIMMITDFGLFFSRARRGEFLSIRHKKVSLTRKSFVSLNLPDARSPQTTQISTPKLPDDEDRPLEPIEERPTAPVWPGGEIPLLLVSAAPAAGGLDEAGGLEDDEAKFKAPLESILMGESCFLWWLGGERRFLGLPRLLEDVDEAEESVDEALKEGVMEMLGAIDDEFESFCGDLDWSNEMAAAAALFVSCSSFSLFCHSRA